MLLVLLVLALELVLFVWLLELLFVLALSLGLLGVSLYSMASLCMWLDLSIFAIVGWLWIFTVSLRVVTFKNALLAELIDCLALLFRLNFKYLKNLLALVLTLCLLIGGLQTRHVEPLLLLLLKLLQHLCLLPRPQRRCSHSRRHAVSESRCLLLPSLLILEKTSTYLLRVGVLLW